MSAEVHRQKKNKQTILELLYFKGLISFENENRLLPKRKQSA